MTDAKLNNSDLFVYLIDKHPNPILFVNSAFKIIHLNSKAKFTLNLKQNTSNKYTKLLNGSESLQKAISAINEVFQKKKTIENIQLEYSFVDKSSIVINTCFKYFEANGNNEDFALVELDQSQQTSKLLPDSMFKNLPNLCVKAFDESGKITYWNKTCEKVLGFTSEEVIGANIVDLLIPDKYNHGIKSFLNKFFDDNSSTETSKIVLQHKNGNELIFLSTKKIIKTPDKSDEVYCFDFDITSEEESASKSKAKEMNLNELVINQSAKLNESEEKFRALADNSLDVIMRFDKELRHQYVNPVVKAVTGIDAEKFIGKTHAELGFPHELVTEWEKVLKRAFDTGKTDRVEFKLPNDIWIDWVIVPEFDLKGNVKYLITAARDITELKGYQERVQSMLYKLENDLQERSEELNENQIKLLEEIKKHRGTQKKLAEREIQYETILNASPNAIFLLDMKGNILYKNPAAESLFNPEANESINLTNIFELVHPEFLEQAKEDFNVTKLEQKNVFSEYKMQPASSESIDVMVSTSVVKNALNNPESILCIIRDITSIKIAQEQVKANEVKYKSLFNLSASGIVLEDLNGFIIDVNPKFCEIHGYSRDELLGQNISMIAYPGSELTIKENLEKLLSGKMLHNVVRNRTKNGSVIYIELYENLVKLGESDQFIIGTTNDISSKIKNQKQISENAARYKTLFDHSPGGIMIEDENGFILEANPTLCNTLGYEHEELVGQHVSIMTSNKNKEIIDNDIKKILNGTNLRQRAATKKKNGDTVIFDLDEVAITLPNGKKGILSISKDISKIVERENNLLIAKEAAEKSNKLKSEFLAQISHEIRSPINVMLSFTSLLQEELNQGNLSELIPTAFNSINLAGKRVIRTIDLILNMSEMQTGSYEPVVEPIEIESDILRDVLIEYTEFAKSKGLELTAPKGKATHTVNADRYSVTQLISNLVDNAIKYTNEGKVSIEVKSSKEDVSIEVSDTGIGIAKNYIPFLFDSFSQEESGYSRKFEGAGLGLALVKKYCDLNGAKISVDSIKGKGTTFVVSFPK